MSGTLTTSASPHYEATTRGLTVRVRPQYLPDQSDPQARRGVWAYFIDIENRSAETVQLLTRRWTITDGRGHVEEVAGPGVVGDQPTLHPGERYSYTSGCPLQTDSGVMVGAYGMITQGGEPFDIAIPAFSLDLPGERRVMN
jgi:ApaG protein